MIASVVPIDVLDALCDCARTAPAGDFVEVGVYKGGSAERLWEIAEQQNRRLFLYDTFTGIPYADELDNHGVGDFADTSVGAVRQVLPLAIICQGIFPETAHEDMQSVAFVHVDCDQYKSVVDTVRCLTPLMVPGGMMWFDDYECTRGATRAVNELFAGRIELIQNKAVVRFP